MTTAAGLLRDAFDASARHLLDVLDGIGDDEFFWEPVPGCWTVHRRDEVRPRPRAAGADGRGAWVIDYEVPEPHPAPVTTIAWRTVHVAAVHVLYHDYAYGSGTATFDLELPGSAAGAVAWLRAAQRSLSDTFAALTDAGLDEPRRTNWGELWPTHRIVTTLTREQVHHGAEISLLRDLYRHRAALGRAT